MRLSTRKFLTLFAFCLPVLSLPKGVNAQDLTCVNCFSLRSIDPGFTDLYEEFNDPNCENAIITGNVMMETCPYGGPTFTCETLAITLRVLISNSEERNIRFVLRGCLEQQILGCLPASNVIAEFEPVFQSVGFNFTVLGSTGSACYCDGNLCNSEVFSLLENSLVTCAFCVSTAFPDPALSAANTDQNVPCEQGIIDGINVMEVGCPGAAGYSCDTSLNEIFFFDPELGIVHAITLFRGCVVGPQNGCLPEENVAENARTALVASGITVVHVHATDCYCSQDNCNTHPSNATDQVLSCKSCFSLRVLDANLGNLFADLINQNCEDGVVDGVSVENEVCPATSASCETIATIMSANVPGFGVVNMSVTFRGCSDIEILECVPSQVIQTGFEADLQAAGINLTVSNMRGSVCYCGYSACNMLTSLQLRDTSVSCVYCISDYFVEPELSDLNTDRNFQCEAGVSGINVLTTMCPLAAGYKCATSFSTVTYFSQDVGEFQLQSVLRSCIPALATECNPYFLQSILSTSVDPTLEIHNADGMECYCSTNYCNDQPFETTVTEPPDSLSCVSCVSAQFGDPSWDAEFRSLNCEDAVIDGLHVIQTACVTSDDICVTITANVEFEDLPPFNTVIRSCAFAAGLGCLDASVSQSVVEAVLGLPMLSLNGDACYCQENNCNDAAVHLNILDFTAPTIVIPCPTNITFVAPPGLTNILVTWEEPIAVDESGSVTVTSNFSPGERFPIGTTTVRYNFEDIAGNSANCSFLVTIEADPFQFVVPCPPDIVVSAPAGQTGVEVSWKEPVVVDSQGNIVDAAEPVAPVQFFPIGTSTITYSYSNSLGKSDSCSFNVIVQVSTFHFLVPCPSDIIVLAPAGQAGVEVTWRKPVVVDSQGNMVDVTGSVAPMQFFPIGTSSIKYSYGDDLGKSGGCSFNVTVKEMTKNNGFVKITTIVTGVLVVAGVICLCGSLFYCKIKKRLVTIKNKVEEDEQPDPVVIYSNRKTEDNTDGQRDREQQNCSINPDEVEPVPSYKRFM